MFSFMFLRPRSEFVLLFLFFLFGGKGGRQEVLIDNASKICHTLGKN